jgi:dipeptidyl-peptidase 4
MRKVLLLILLAATLFAQKKPITLETMNEGRGGGGGRGGAQAVWAPDGKTFLTRTGRSLAIYNPATKTSKDLVSTEAMDAAAVKGPNEDGPVDWTNRRASNGGMQWSQSGKEILYSGGGDIFLIHVDTGKWEQLTHTPEVEREAKLSPDSKTVAFRRGYDLYAVDTASGKETRLTRGGSETLRNGTLDWVYPEELDLSTAYWWSPDSKAIVYMQFDTTREPVYPHEDVLRVRALYEPERYPQSGENNADIHLGVVPASGGPTKWLEVGDTRNSYLIARAGWMPDSKSAYVIRMNRVQNRLEMLSIGVESGSATTIFKETDPYWINLKDDVAFLRDGKRFLWTSERDGYRHVYVYSVDGKEVKQATKGPWEVRAVNAVDDKLSRIYYTSTEGSSLETHLYSVKLDGGDKKRLDNAAGSHTISMGPGASFYLDTVSTLTDPPRTTLHSTDGAELGVYREADRRQQEEFDILPTEIVSFKGPDGTLLYGKVIKPKGFETGKKYPAIVSVYGGPGVGLPIHNSWSGVSIDQAYAHHGYVVWQAENRGGQGRGHGFETPIYRSLGPTELTDQVAGVKFLISMGYVDAARVGIHGWSYGGFMTLNAVLNAPDVFKCGIAGAPVTSWMNYDTIYTERYMGLPSENPEGYRSTALPAKAKNLKAKLMIVHNFEDDNVLFQNTLQMTDALQLADKQFEFMLYPQKSHGVSGVAARQMNESMLDFFDRNLK